MLYLILENPRIKDGLNKYQAILYHKLGQISQSFDTIRECEDYLIFNARRLNKQEITESDIMYRRVVNHEGD